uniref:Uncharacterized protein n=1 Tax=Octopus bimaculoides TaxID=37653 RepID=A0A0L8H7L4_OCTBM
MLKVKKENGNSRTFSRYHASFHMPAYLPCSQNPIKIFKFTLKLDNDTSYVSVVAVIVLHCH